ncbi:Hypothetical predicted protein [Podarcis lilfordi]|uniref:Uncharacterized protein n=1 Tax=Podarcis lilfordi TaxID=74358 RepID=A0AA35L1I9_9SAUR|nr:Hypothetical predicted protein [Podarcis lilfordi]
MVNRNLTTFLTSYDSYSIVSLFIFLGIKSPLGKCSGPHRKSRHTALQLVTTTTTLKLSPLVLLSYNGHPSI